LSNFSDPVITNNNLIISNVNNLPKSSFWNGSIFIKYKSHIIQSTDIIGRFNISFPH
jgi:hypothetical protein